MPDSPYPGPPDADEPPRPAAPADDPGGTDAAPAAPAACAVCGAELDPGQTYCLECGSPTPAAPRLRRGVGGLAVVAAGLAILGAGAGALAFVASDEQPGSAVAPVTQAETAPVITVPTTTTPTTATDSSLPGDTVATTGTVPTATTPVDTTSTLPMDTTAVPGSGLLTETAPASGQTTSELPSGSGAGADAGSGSAASGSASGSGEWPAGTSGWTVIVASDTSEAGAKSTAGKLRAQGQSGGVLFSSDHPPLRPGYWVAFSGTYTSRSEALSAAQSLVSSWPGAYPRKIDS